jgi:uncharacterized protein YecE (DUF72 family)
MEIPLKKQKRYGFFKPTEEVFQAWEATCRFANDLGSDLIVFQSPASFAPAEANKKNMIGFFGSVKRDGLTLIWEPRGEWKDEEIRSLCEELGLIHCVDPLKARPLHGRLRYYRLHGPLAMAAVTEQKSWVRSSS